MARDAQIFEIHVQRSGRWTIDRTAEGQSDAEAQARTLLRAPDVSGVKVVREVSHGSSTRESVVLELSASGGSDRIAVGDITDAPDCEETSDLFAIGGRTTINRLFRAYLDKTGVTASEAMHDFRELRRAIDADTIMVSAIGKVATLQAKGKADLTVNTRRDELFGMLDQILARSKAAAEAKLPSIRKSGFEAAIASVLDGTSALKDEEPDYLARVIMTRELVQQRSFMGKMVQTLDWVEPAEDSRARTLADGFLADTTANASVIQDLLGPQTDLASALGQIMDLSQGTREGEAESDPTAPASVAVRLNALMADGNLPDTRHMLIDRVCRQLESKAPLVSGDPEGQVDAFRDFLAKVMTDDDLIGGGEMAGALVNRQSRIINKGGLAGLREATGRMLPYFKEPVQKASYLLTLSHSRLGQDLGEEIGMLLEGLFIRPDKIRQIVRDDRAPNKKMEAVTAVFHKVGSADMSAVTKKRILEHLDEILAGYIVNDRILERIDDPSRPLHIRAFMLLSMCTPEVLPEGKASALARKIIVKHLRRPSFETELVKQVPDGEKEEVLRRFHVQLYRCGFMGSA
jgi:hypothetical protein